MDRPTFEELYRKHFNLARSALRRKGVKRPAEIEELAQEVFIVVHRKLAELDLENTSIKGWIYRIATHVALNHVRLSSTRREAAMAPEEQEALFPEPGSSEGRLADREHLRLVLAGTTPERREVYELVEVQGFSVAEAAFALEIPFKTADSRLRGARREVHAANAHLQRRKTGGRAAILPIGVGAWLHLREITTPPPGAAGRLWTRIQSMSSSGRSAEEDRPRAPEKKPWPRRVPALLRRMMEPALGAVGGAALTLLYLHPTRAPDRESTYEPAVTITQEVKGEPAATLSLDGINDETSPTTLPAALGVDPSKAANPAALLALRKAQAAYVVGDKLAALDALEVFEREFFEDPLRISAERLRALVLRPLAANQ